MRRTFQVAKNDIREDGVHEETMVEAIGCNLSKNSYMNFKDHNECNNNKPFAESLALGLKVTAQNCGYNMTIQRSVYHSPHALSLKETLPKIRKGKDMLKLGHKLILQCGTFVCAEKEREKCGFRFVVTSYIMVDDDGDDVVVYDLTAKCGTNMHAHD